MHHHVSRVLPYTPDQLFKLVGEITAYPEFVPWVTGMRTWNARHLSEGVDSVDAEAQVGFSFLKERFSTWVRHDRNAPKVEVGLLRGPFHHLRNRWEFFPHPEGTRVEFFIDFAFKSKVLDLMLQANFDRAVGRLMRCFEARAAHLYGPKA